MSRYRLRIPDTFTILLVIMAIFVILTWVVPAGEYARETQTIGGITKEVLIPGSYESTDASPQGLWAYLMAPIRGFRAAAQILGFCFIVGGSFGIFNSTGAINAGIGQVLKISKRRPSGKKIIVPVVMILFSLAGATFGMSESVLVFIMITIPLSIALGYDSIVGISMSFLAAGVGFAGAFFNPFTIGIAQGIAEIPVFSGWEYRIVIWVVMTTAAILWTLRYMHRIDIRRITGYVDPDLQNELSKTKEEFIYTRKHKIILWILLLTFVILIYGSNRWSWYINEISGLFMAAGILVAIVSGMGSRKSMEAFVEGAKSMTMAALVIGISRGLLIIVSDGKIIDTMLHGMSQLTENISPVFTAQIMFLVQGAINFFVPSGSGQAALTMPIMAPLSDLVEVSRQTAVLAFQLGDGIFNMIIPTSGVTMGALSIAKIPYQKWVKWVWPFILILLILSLLLLIPPTILFVY